jgi:hypothetical protein
MLEPPDAIVLGVGVSGLAAAVGRVGWWGCEGGFDRRALRLPDGGASAPPRSRPAPRPAAARRDAGLRAGSRHRARPIRLELHRPLDAVPQRPERAGSVTPPVVACVQRGERRVEDPRAQHGLLRCRPSGVSPAARTPTPAIRGRPTRDARRGTEQERKRRLVRHPCERSHARGARSMTFVAARCRRLPRQSCSLPHPPVSRPQEPGSFPEARVQRRGPL